eukprot:2186539-Rhodomonas_salina.1
MPCLSAAYTATVALSQYRTHYYHILPPVPHMDYQAPGRGLGATSKGERVVAGIAREAKPW